MAIANRDIQLKTALERDVRPVRLEPGSFEYEAAPGASPQLAGHLMRRLSEWTGTRWMVAVVSQGGAPTLREQSAAGAQQRQRELESHPVVSRVLELFPGSRISQVRDLTKDLPLPEPVATATGGDDEVGYADALPLEAGEADPDSDDNDL